MGPEESKEPMKDDYKEVKETKDSKGEKQEEIPMSLDGDVEPTYLKLKSKDGKSFTIQQQWTDISVLIKTAFDTDKTTTELKLTAVDSLQLAEIISYMEHHKGVEPEMVGKPLRSKVMREVCKDQFDADFIDRISKKRKNIYDLVLAANYLDMKCLLHLGCAKIASLIKGEPLDKVKTILSTDDDTTSNSSTSSSSSTSANAAT